MTLFSDTIRAHRRSTGQDLERVATSARLSPAQMWRFEDGLDEPTVKEARRIMIALGISNRRGRWLELCRGLPVMEVR